MNPAAIHLLEANPDMIYWPYLSMNPAAIHLLEANLNIINWNCLCFHPTEWAINLLEANHHKMGKELGQSHVHKNPAIFRINHKKITELAHWLHKL